MKVKHWPDTLAAMGGRDGIQRFREAVWRKIPSDWDIYRQVEHLFRRQVPLILGHPQNFQIYLNLASSGMKGFANRYSQKGAKLTPGVGPS